jgi:glycosyltransferase involved in cell wall biosynthesis
MKYPFILLFRKDVNNYIDTFFSDNASRLECTLHIVNDLKKLNRFYKQIYPLLVVFGDKTDYDTVLQLFVSDSERSRLLFLDKIVSIENFNQLVNTLFINICGIPRRLTRPVFSVFTPTFNSFEKILRAFNSLKAQTLTNWEWIIMDDSPDDTHFQYLKKKLSHDARIRIYRRFENNGYIGNVKNEAVSLCRGQFVLELDHDDEILPFVLEESAKTFRNNLEVGFVYMDFINIYENGNNFRYGDNICKGYGSYYCQKYGDKWVYVYNTPNINNITLSHLVCCPNHPRIWRKDALLEMGNFCEYLPICDDYEIILRTAVHTKIAKIPKMGYIQYMNESNNNFSLIRNAEINRIGPHYISPIYYQMFNIHELMKQKNAYESIDYLHDNTPIWTRDPSVYTHKFCNLLVNNDYKQQYCVIGINGLLRNLNKIKELYSENNDIIVLENKCPIEHLWKKLDDLGFSKMKCYVLLDRSEDELVNYFKVCYQSTNNYEILSAYIGILPYNTNLNERHLVINQNTSKEQKYLEIGVEYGYTFSKTHFRNKIGVDPDPKFSIADGRFNNIICQLYSVTSDDYFAKYSRNNESSSVVNIADTIDVIFIDGLHHCENVLRDFNNSVRILNPNGFIFIDDILPLNYNEQLKIPTKHYYEKGILKYGEEWTGDVWKFVYYLLRHFYKNIKYNYYYHIAYRGIIRIEIVEPFELLVDDKAYCEMNNYDYYYDFSDYLQLLDSHKTTN